MRRMIHLSLAVVAATLFLTGAATVSAQSDGFNEKFKFEGVELDEGSITATVYAGSKQSGQEGKQNLNTTCTYFDEAGAFLGYSITDDFASTDPDAVQGECVALFPDRHS
jgi:uncharacterized protein (DUF2141 family)